VRVTRVGEDNFRVKQHPNRTALQSVILRGVLVFYVLVYFRPVHYVLV